LTLQCPTIFELEFTIPTMIALAPAPQLKDFQFKFKAGIFAHSDTVIRFRLV